MNIYIYGNSGFKKEIHSTLDHANIKFKLDDSSIIKDVMSLDELKNTIIENPNDIYLIDDEKIIKKNSKIKFLNPKDGIEESFLLDNGIADLSVESFAEIPKYILQKHEEQKLVDDDIQNSIIDIVDEAYGNDEDDFDLELDNELSQLLAKDEPSEEEEETKKEDELLAGLDDIMGTDEPEDLSLDVNLDEIDELLKDDPLESLDAADELSDDDFSHLMNFDEDVGLNNVTSDYDDEENITEKEEKNNDDDNINELDDFLNELSNEDLPNFDTIEEKKENNIENTKIEDEVKSSQGVQMADEFSELDALNEKDIMDALSGIDSPVSTPVKSTSKTSEESIAVSSANVGELSELINKLLQNKTLEITIKIKD